jgi:hypothetical protein
MRKAAWRRNIIASQAGNIKHNGVINKLNIFALSDSYLILSAGLALYPTRKRYWTTIFEPYTSTLLWDNEIFSQGLWKQCLIIAHTTLRNVHILRINVISLTTL